MEVIHALDRIFDRQIDRQREEAKTNGDYYKDGILFCHKCNTPKEYWHEYEDGEKRLRPILCDCEAKQHKEEQEREEADRRRIRVNGLRHRAFADSRMASWTFERNDSPDSKYTEIAKRYVDKFDEMFEKGKGLLLFGSVGTGKTFLAACIANALIEKEHICYMTNFSRIVNDIQEKFDGRQQYIDNLNRCELLIIDDLAAERDTEFMNEIVMHVIDSRYQSGKPLIITTNLTGNDMRGSADITKQRIYSRLFEMCFPVEVKGNDRRKEKMKAEYEEMASLLGL